MDKELQYVDYNKVKYVVEDTFNRSMDVRRQLSRCESREQQNSIYDYYAGLLENTIERLEELRKNKVDRSHNVSYFKGLYSELFYYAVILRMIGIYIRRNWDYDKTDHLVYKTLYLFSVGKRVKLLYLYKKYLFEVNDMSEFKAMYRRC